MLNYYWIDFDGSGFLGFLKVYCNMIDGSFYIWWVGKVNEKYYYWGGFGFGIQKCVCGIECNCIDFKYYCNCDVDYKQWRKDVGFLLYKDYLLVS